MIPCSKRARLDDDIRRGTKNRVTEVVGVTSMDTEASWSNAAASRQREDVSVCMSARLPLRGLVEQNKKQHQPLSSVDLNKQFTANR